MRCHYGTNKQQVSRRASKSFLGFHILQCRRITLVTFNSSNYTSDYNSLFFYRDDADMEYMNTIANELKNEVRLWTNIELSIRIT